MLRKPDTGTQHHIMTCLDRNCKHYSKERSHHVRRTTIWWHEDE